MVYIFFRSKMKVKEINQMANVAWSPASVHPLYLACGTAAQQLDASLNTNSTLNIYNANLGQANLETKLAVSVETPGRLVTDLIQMFLFFIALSM